MYCAANGRDSNRGHALREVSTPTSTGARFGSNITTSLLDEHPCSLSLSRIIVSRMTRVKESRMAKIPITKMGWRCERCAHEGIPKTEDYAPLTCPHCKSPYWERPRPPRWRRAKP